MQWKSLSIRTRQNLVLLGVVGALLVGVFLLGVWV